MSPDATSTLLARLSDRDVAILESLSCFRLLTTAQIRRLHFHDHANQGAASTAAMRVLDRLEARNLVARLKRRIGGVRAGSSGISWQLGAVGERLLRVRHGGTARRRYLEPSAAFADHTLAVADAAIELWELQRTGALDELTIETEPYNWRSFVGPLGTTEWLKPDLFAITTSGDFEDHRFIEVDLATEHPPVVLRKAKAYQRYAATGAHQAQHGLFPAVVWLVPDERRQRSLEYAFERDAAIQPELFRVITRDQLTAVATNQLPEPPTKGGPTPSNDTHSSTPTSQAGSGQPQNASSTARST
ncbi:replication-relaxation family protein [Actinokineospora bangkokensis]|uniref:Replication-relaxation n=1 Tax=Actinokineospora bangkokensis TaxID=1193682 RepID=A0A1Q9LC22_9PSEU|nr:replication-relaxation family protein [Actinokineospora bangkokensis]OLR89555.1 hypothetical protein BJP25_05620 [Actinokineospora bangkokensis]